MQKIPLAIQERGAERWKFVIGHADLTETADNTAQSITLMALEFHDVVSHHMIVDVTTAFSGGSVTTCTLSIGVTSALTQFVNGQDVMAAGAIVPAATVADYPVPSGGKTLYATFTPDASHDLEDLTAGELEIFVTIDRTAERP
jgi:hypothetical protein